MIIENDSTHYGLRCICIMTNMGHRCGYVGIPTSHPLYNSHYNKLYNKNIDFDIHGGITFSDYGHKGYPIKSRGTYWFGFDCNHYGDRPDPKYAGRPFYRNGIIRSKEYVVNECIKLAEQLYNMEKK